MSKFKVGDRVKLVNPMELGRNFWGRTGVVLQRKDFCCR